MVSSGLAAAQGPKVRLGAHPLGRVFALGMSYMQQRRQLHIRLSQQPRGKSKRLTFLPARAGLDQMAEESKLPQISNSLGE